MLLLIAAFSWAIYTACLRWQPPELDQLTFAAASITIGVIALAVIFLGESLQPFHLVGAAVIFTGIYLATARAAACARRRNGG